jgi:hypothetical protein
MPKSFPPPLISKHRIRWLALRFGSTDETVEGIANPFDRERCLARIEFERERARINRDATFKNFGSPDGSLESIKDPAARETAKAFVVEGYSGVEFFCREELLYPGLLRGKGITEVLLNPWFKPESNQ